MVLRCSPRSVHGSTPSCSPLQCGSLQPRSGTDPWTVSTAVGGAARIVRAQRNSRTRDVVGSCPPHHTPPGTTRARVRQITANVRSPAEAARAACTMACTHGAAVDPIAHGLRLMPRPHVGAGINPPSPAPRPAERRTTRVAAAVSAPPHRARPAPRWSSSPPWARPPERRRLVLI